MRAFRHRSTLVFPTGFAEKLGLIPLEGNINASVAQTLGALTGAITTTVGDAEVVSQTLGALTGAITTTVGDAAVVSQTLGALIGTIIVTTAALVNSNAALTRTLGKLKASCTATVDWQHDYLTNPDRDAVQVLEDGSTLHI